MKNSEILRKFWSEKEKFPEFQDLRGFSGVMISIETEHDLSAGDFVSIYSNRTVGKYDPNLPIIGIALESTSKGEMVRIAS